MAILNSYVKFPRGYVIYHSSYPHPAGTASLGSAVCAKRCMATLSRCLAARRSLRFSGSSW